MTARPLVSELAKPLSPLEVAIGVGSPRRNPRALAALPNGPELDAAMATWALLAYVLGEAHAPKPHAVVRWKASDRAAARHWGERELCRRTIGEVGCDSLTTPRVLERYVAAWRTEP